MPRKKVDSRVRTLIENGVKTHTRSFFVLVGDRGKDQVANLHYILTKAQVKARPSVLWCYSKELGFSTHRQKRMRQIKKMQARGIYDPEKEDPFDLFISSTNIRWCYYKETQRILGSTYGMVVLQDYEAITPNILCRAIETVEGGGIVVLLLHTMSSLKQLYTLTMDVHARFRTDAHADVVGRFNERFILSLASCPSCLVLDDELNVLPISKHAKDIKPLAVTDDSDDDDGGAATGKKKSAATGIVAEETAAQKELASLKSSLAGTELVGALAGLTKTLDQAQAVLTFAEAISEKTLRSTVALTAGRGRGKSAALGLAIAAAVGYGYSNIFVTSPSPENLKTLFEFVFKGLEALSYKEHLDYEAVASSHEEYKGAIVRVNIFNRSGAASASGGASGGHRQTVQYIDPSDADKLAQAELVVVDEAAAIPLPLVKRLLGPYLVFLASTVNGYEGTGRSLSLKLIQQLRQQQASSTFGAAAGGAAVGGAGTGGSASMALSLAAAAGGGAMPGASAGGGGGSGGGRTLREVALNEPIRYASGDAVEGWLNTLLCLDATTPHRLVGRLPAPSECTLYAVDRDALFSYHRLSEAFLHRMMSLYVSSHYKNSPNDLQLMSDAPAHKLFVLLGPQSEESAAKAAASDAPALPDVLCVIQVCLEGRVSKDSLKAALARGARAAGDLIPWTLSQQFQDDGFAQLSGARVVRIATHPDAVKMGYGSRAIELLSQFYQGQLVTFDDGDDESGVLAVDRGLHYAATAATGGAGAASAAASAATGELTVEKVRPRKELPPLLVNAADIRRPERLHWLGVSYGLTLQLFNFWRRGGYLPAYLRQTANDLTAEHTMIMMKPLDCSDMTAGTAPKPGWFAGFVADFARRYMSLLSYEFRTFDATLALSIMDAACSTMGSRAAASGDDEDGAGVAAASAKKPAASGASASAAEVAAAVARADLHPLRASELGLLFTPHDLKRLESYSRGLVDYHMILDLLPDIARLYFQGRLPEVSLPRLQAGILLSLGLQRSTVDDVSAHFDIASNQTLAVFAKSIRKVANSLSALHERAVADGLEGGAKSAKKAVATPGSSKKAAAAADSDDDAAGAARSSSGAGGLLASDKETLAKFAVPADAPMFKAAAGGAAASASAGAGSSVSGHKRSGKEQSGGRGTDASIYDPSGRLAGKNGAKRARSAKE